MITFHQATSADLKCILAFDHIAQHDHTREICLQQAIDSGTLTTIRQDSKIIGYYIVEQHFFSHHFLSLLYIKPKVRNQGIGSQALIHILQQYQHVPKFFTSTNLSNSPMIHVLKKAGFQDSGIIYHLDDNDPELIFCYQPDTRRANKEMSQNT